MYFFSQVRIPFIISEAAHSKTARIKLSLNATEGVLFTGQSMITAGTFLTLLCY